MRCTIMTPKTPPAAAPTIANVHGGGGADTSKTGSPKPTKSTINNPCIPHVPCGPARNHTIPNGNGKKRGPVDRTQLPHPRFCVPVLDRSKPCGPRQQHRQEIPLGRAPRELQRLSNKPQHLRQQRNGFSPRCRFQVFLVGRSKGVDGGGGGGIRGVRGPRQHLRGRRALRVWGRLA